MANDKMMAQMSGKGGFIAALDQSGGSTPGALRLYGIPDNAYSGDAEMFKLMHEMRVRIMTAPAFTGDKVIGAILFEATMDGEAQGKPVPTFLWEERGVVPFLKVDKGLEAEKDGVSLMRPIPGLDALLDRAGRLGVFGTKMRSVINLPSKGGIAAIVTQQF
jgi:fructose-bisphosphate aldolase class I